MLFRSLLRRKLNCSETEGVRYTSTSRSIITLDQQLCGTLFGMYFLCLCVTVGLTKINRSVGVIHVLGSFYPQHADE